MFPVIRAPPNQSVCLGSVAIALLHDPPPSSLLSTTPYSSPQTERQCDACKREEGDGDGDAHFVSSDRERASEPNFLLSVRMRKGKQASREGKGREGEEMMHSRDTDGGLESESYPNHGGVHPRLEKMFLTP